jgi:hypothetical protein
MLSVLSLQVQVFCHSWRIEQTYDQSLQATGCVEGIPETMSKQAGGRPAKSGARRELKTFRLVPTAIERLERMASERGGTTSDVLNELLLEAAEAAELSRQRRLEVVPVANELGVTSSPAVTRFRVLPGGGRGTEEAAPKVAHELERLRDSLAGVLAEIEDLMTEQLGEESPKADEYATGFRSGMLEALETCYALLQAELLMSEGS